MQSPAALEAGDEVLQVLEVCEAVEEAKEVIVTTVAEDANTDLLPGPSSGPSTQASQVRLRAN